MIDEIKALAGKIRLEHILINPKEMFIAPEDVTLDIGDKGDLINTFPVPECAECAAKCCPPRLELSLFDMARFMDKGLDEFISGTFEGYTDFSASQSDDGEFLGRPAPYITCMPTTFHCTFLDECERCSIYESRTPACRSFPLTLCQDVSGELVIQWMARCQSYSISDNKTAFLQLFDSTIRSCNEWMGNHMLMVHARKQLRSLGFAKYLGDEQKYLR